MALLHTNFVRLISRGPKYTGKPLGSVCAFICSFCSWRMSGPCLISPWRALWRTMDKQWKVVSLNKHILLSIRAAANLRWIINFNIHFYMATVWLIRVVSHMQEISRPHSHFKQEVYRHSFWRTIVWFEPPFAPLRALMPPPPVWDHRSPACSPGSCSPLKRSSLISLLKIWLLWWEMLRATACRNHLKEAEVHNRSARYGVMISR